jgi:DNA-binding response OmpR family regulator
MQILVVEDEPRMAGLLRRTLEEEGHQVVVVSDGQQGFEIARNSPFDAVVLDIMLPGMDGISVARKLRECRNNTPVLLLTARDAPFSIDILLARLRAISRRGAVPRPVYLEVADVRLDPASRQVTRGDKLLNLTAREYKLLELFMRNRGRAISRDKILESVWGFSTEVTGNNVEVFVRQLRLKVDTSEPKLIHTVRGFGYMMREP